MNKLIITEKPSVGAAYAALLGAKKRMDGYWEGNGYLVSWCLGHLVELHVFDVSTFTVTGENVTADMKTDAEGHLTSYMADVDNDANMEHDTEVVHDGYFAESEKRSAPYFDIAIDGIVRLDVNFG